ncbi:hypothetical protein LCGC14_0809240 [marine sediment metagenome]|uniref:Uncharacterized protein n=1 Tax=marine sediment metagenome TaxID=412755 RepID=A0A0F9Q7C6_9ZZZZ
MTKMSERLDIIEKIKKIPYRNFEILDDLIKIIKKIIEGKREIMYSDIINLIIREGYLGENYKQIIIWCNYKIRLGKYFVEI